MIIPQQADGMSSLTVNEGEAMVGVGEVFCSDWCSCSLVNTISTPREAFWNEPWIKQTRSLVPGNVSPPWLNFIRDRDFACRSEIVLPDRPIIKPDAVLDRSNFNATGWGEDSGVDESVTSVFVVWEGDDGEVDSASIFLLMGMSSLELPAALLWGWQGISFSNDGCAGFVTFRTFAGNQSPHKNETELKSKRYRRKLRDCQFFERLSMPSHLSLHPTPI